MLKVHKAFTIVELMIVVIVIGILASIVIVGYKNATKDSNMSAIKSDLQAAHTSVKRYLNEENRLPTSLSEAGLADTPAAVLGYMYSGDNFCISAVAKSGGFQMHIVRDGVVSDGLCPPLGPAANPNNCFELNGAWVVGYYNYELDNASMPACTKNVVIPAAINGLDIVGIDNEAFMETGLTSVVISDGIETIGDRAFYGNNLTTAIIPQSVTWIGDDAFKENNLTEVKIVANSVWGTPFDLDVVITYY